MVLEDAIAKNQAASKSIANVTKLTSDAIRTVVALAAGTLRIEKKNPAQKNK
jgi:hypothetical protein